MIDLTALRAEVERIKTVKGSVKAAFVGLAAKLEACKNDPAEVQALANDLRTEADEIAADVVANTPAEVPPPANP